MVCGHSKSALQARAGLSFPQAIRRGTHLGAQTETRIV